MNKLTMQHKMTHIMRNLLLLLISGIILVACSPPQSSEVPPAAGINVFSHNSYRFAPSLDTRIPSDGTNRPLASIFVNENEVKKLVGRRLGLTDDQTAIAGLTSANYTLSYRINAASTASAATFFSVEGSTDNFLQATISVADPVGAGLSLTGILNIVSSFQVEVSIKILPQDTNQADLKSFVQVTFQKQGPRLSLDNVFTNNIAGLNNNINLTPRAEVKENAIVTASASLSRRGNILSEYALRRNSDLAGLTLFLALRDLNDTNNDCGDGEIYLDNTDLRIKAARDYNYEVDPRPSYLCRIFASGDGLTYKPLAIAVSNSVATTIDERGNAITGTNVETIQDFALVRPSNDSSVDCSNANACYYADLDIQVANVDELPKIEFSAPNQQAFMGIREGVGVLDAYSTNNPSLASAIGLATATGFNDKANQLNITDRDWATGTTNPLPVAEVVVADVSPSHGRGIFSIEPNGIDNNNNWALFVDSTKLDYEAFSAGQLSPTGKAIYKVFIRATDDAVADGGGAKSFTTAFDFEVTDVIYRPLLVDSSSSSIEVLGATDAFTRSSDDIVMEGNVIYLLSGSQALRNSLHRVGSFAAIDPETGDDRNLEYSITSTSAAILENFALINNSPRGRRLIISGTGLAQGATATISLTATHKGLATATNQASIKLEVDDSRYEVDTILSASTPKFNTTIPQGKIIEGTTTATVTYPSNLTNIEELAGNYVTGEGDKLLFGFAPTSTLRNTADLRSLGIRFDNRKFDIAEDTGKISAKDDTIEFNNPGSYDLLVYTARKSDFDAATSENAFFSNNGTLYDLSIISVVVTDINSAPLAREANRRMINTEEPLAITIKEDRAKAGTEVARIFITDDNDKTTREFTLDKTSNPGLFNVNWVNNNNGVTGIITLARDLDYETNKDLNNPTYSLNVSDRGRYSFNTISDQATPVNPATDQETISIPIDFTLEDVNEAPQLMLMVDEGRISESAQIGDLVSPSNGAGDNTLFRITNLREINPTQLSYAIEGPFKDILDVKAMPANLTQNRILAELEVINANRLENLGDGRTFIATIRVTDAASRLTSRINLPIMIINDFSADFQISDDYLANLIINEQDVAEGKLEVQGFKIPAASISRDDDDNFAANRRLQSIIFDVTARPQSTLDPVLTKVNVFEVFRRGDNYLLRVTDRDFIENNLFGDLDLAIAIRRQLSAEDAIASSARGVVTINRATPKLISYAGATNDPRAALTPPVYSISYTQTAYAAAVSPSTEQEPTPASDIQLDLNNIRGLSADGLIAHNNFVYPTLTLRDENGRNYRNFIRRAASRSTLVNKNNNAVLDISNINSQIVRINLKLPQKFEQVSERFDILKEDGKGNLVDAIGEFENFFTLELINSTNNLPPQLQITQRVFNSTATEASGTEISGNYNALDTIPLFAGEETTQSIVMNYFIRSYAEPYSSRNAASYALAQFSVRVTATGQITQPTQEYLVSNLNLFPVPNEPGSVRFQWTNPANLTGTDLANLTLSVSSYSEETRGDGRIETTMTLDGTYLAVGLQSLNLPLSTGRYYEFSVTPNFSSAKQLGLIATSPRVFIGTNPNILSKFVVENIRTTLLTGDADGVSLSWTNPANLTGTDITAINLIINSYTAETGEADKTETTMTLIDGNLTSGPQSLNLTLATGRYYEFSLTPVFSSATQQGIKVTSSPRVLVPVPVVVSEFMVANITITHLTGDADGVSLSWTNPANLTGTDITAINLVINNYTAATGEEGKTETTMTLNGTYLRAGLQSLNLPLATGRYYEFSLTPVFSSATQQGIKVTSSPRVFIGTNPEILSKFVVENIRTTLLTGDADGVSLSWTNPTNLTGTDITAINLVINNYTAATGEEGKTETTMTLNGTYLRAGPQSLNLPLATGRYYEFSLTPVFSSATQQGIKVTSSPRILVLVPVVVSEFMVENILPTLLTGDADGVSLSWTNPTNLTGTDITAINLIINNYTAATGEEGKTETTMTLNGTYLRAGLQSLNLTLATGRYYEFSLTPVFSADNHRGVTVTSSPRILVPVPVVVSEFMVANITITHLTGDADGVSLSWTNPTNLTETSLTSINLTIRSYSEETGGDGQMETTMTLNGTYLRAGLQSLNLTLATGRYYEFSVTPVFSSATQQGIKVTSSPRVLVDNDSTDSDADGVIDIQDVDDDGDGLIEIYTAADFNNIRNNLNGTGFSNTLGSQGRVIGCGGMENITECNGYELMNDISLSEYTNWQPLGGCVSGNCLAIQGGVLTATADMQYFRGDFRGNGYTISNMSINVITDNIAGVGLFGAITDGALIADLNLVGDVRVANDDMNVNMIGGLVGYATSSLIDNSSFAGEVVAAIDPEPAATTQINPLVKGSYYVGGLVGYADTTHIYSSNVRSTMVAGTSLVGGLVGLFRKNNLLDSNVDITLIRASSDRIGGLGGQFEGATVAGNHAKVGRIEGRNNIGGLVGFFNGGAIVFSASQVDEITGSGRNIGGLVGQQLSFASQIISSYAHSGSISADQIAAGLVGFAPRGLQVFYSYASSFSINARQFVNGFDTQSAGATNLVRNSYWDSRTNFIDGRSVNTFSLTSTELQSPTNFISIYSSWGDGWCGVDPTTGGVFYNFNASDPREDLRQDEYRGWNLGVAKDYPALSCLPVSLEEQRSFDFDGDDLRGDADNCPLVASSDTTDTDGDGAGNPCDNDDDGDGVTDDQDLAPLDENIGALQEYQLADFTASAMTDKALLRWTNPTNLTGTSLTSINLTIRSYSAATGENGLVETTTMTLIDGNLTSGPQSLNLTLATGRYYDFSLTPVFSADNHRGVTVTTSPRILVPIDSDGDGVADSDDMDADGDGLIDIYMATDFDNIRNNLVSTGLSSITGCGDRASITECRGYELMNNISLSSYANWDPIGTGLNKFEAIFEGNNNSINNLKITSASSDSVGLFAGFAGSTQVRNLVLSNISIEVTQNLVGGLVGEISNATITNVHLNKVNITGGENVGGLAGSMDNGVIIDTSVQGEDIVATTGNVGGLLGHSYAGELNNSWVIWREITTPGANAGGIIGLHQSDGFELSVNATYAQANLIEGNMNVGGLIGNGNITLERLNYLHIESSYAHIKTLKAVTKNSGGLVGRNFGNRSVSIKYSYSIIENLDNPQLDSAAGLAFHPLNTDIEDSYWDASTNFTQGDPFASGIDRVDERVLGNRTTSELQSGQPSDGGIYSSWDPLFWDFGTNNEYPVLSNLVGNFVKQQKRSAFTE